MTSFRKVGRHSGDSGTLRDSDSAGVGADQIGAARTGREKRVFQISYHRIPLHTIRRERMSGFFKFHTTGYQFIP
jgi:hypothetical protein